MNERDVEKMYEGIAEMEFALMTSADDAEMRNDLTQELLGCYRQFFSFFISEEFAEMLVENPKMLSEMQRRRGSGPRKQTEILREEIRKIWESLGSDYSDAEKFEIICERLREEYDLTVGALDYHVRNMGLRKKGKS